MRKKTTVFYRGNTEISVEFSAEEVSSDGAVVLLDKLEANTSFFPVLKTVWDRCAVFELCHGWLERYVETLDGRSHLIIDIDATDDPTHGNQ